MLVDNVVKDHQPQVGHAQVVDVGKGQGDFEVDFGPILDDLVVFAAGVTAGFVDAGQNALQRQLDLFGSL
jgi:hypothetical protein